MLSLEMAPRFAEIHLVSTPADSVVGCFKLAPTLAAAELGLSPEEYERVLDVLVQNRLIERHDGYVLVRRWFRHHKWESVFKGGVLKRALQEVEKLPDYLKSKWIEACTEAGVPQQAAEQICYPEGPQGEAPEGPEHYNKNNNQTENATPTPTPTDRSSGGVSLILSPKLEAIRPFIEKATSQLDARLGQMVVDELAGAVSAAQVGNRPAIGSMQKWLSAVIRKAKDGDFIPELGVMIAEQRESRTNDCRRRVAEEDRVSQDRQALQSRIDQAEVTLGKLDPDSLQTLIKQVVASTSTLLPRKRIVDELSSRLVPRGLGCSEALVVIEGL